MVKLQSSTKPNGSVTYSVNIPLEIIERLDWKKGDNLMVVSDMSEYGLPKIVIAREVE